MNHFFVFLLVVFGQGIAFWYLLRLEEWLASDSLLDLFKICFVLERLILLLDLTRGTWALGVGCFSFLEDLVCLVLSVCKEVYLSLFWLLCLIKDWLSLSLLLVLVLFEDWSKKLDLSTVLFRKHIIDGSFSIASFEVLKIPRWNFQI